MPHIILVEDHHDTRQMYAVFLSELFDLRTAENGQQALEFINVCRPDLLITDLSLPGMDGLELVRRIRSNASLRGLPIVCLSGYGGHVHEERALEAGCDRVLQKPCLPDELARVVGEMLKESQGRTVAG